MKAAILFILLLVGSLHAGVPWPGVEFSAVRAYAWSADQEAVILSGMALKPGAINPDGSVLTPKQVKRLVAAVTGKHRWHPIASCHVPRNAVVFYDRAERPVAYVEICFGCFNYRKGPDERGGNRHLDFVTLASIFEEQKLPVGEYSDATAFKKAFDEAKRITKE